MSIRCTDYPQESMDTMFAGGRNEYLHKGFSSGSFSCTFYNLELLRKGRYTLFVNGNAIEVQSGDLYILPPYVVQEKVVQEEGSATSYLGIQIPELKRYMNGFNIQNNAYICRPTERSIQYMEELIDSLEQHRVFEAYKEKPYQFCFTKGTYYSNHTPHEAELRQNGLFSLFFSQLLHDHGVQSSYNSAQLSKDDYVKKAMQFIKTNYKEDISVDIVAQNIGLHRSYLYTLFQQYAGVSVCDYILQTRITAACDFLRQGNIPIKAVAVSVGYNPITFARAFKKQMGITATEYQRKYLSQENLTELATIP